MIPGEEEGWVGELGVGLERLPPLVMIPVLAPPISRLFNRFASLLTWFAFRLLLPLIMNPLAFIWFDAAVVVVGEDEADEGDGDDDVAPPPPVDDDEENIEDIDLFYIIMVYIYPLL